MPTVACPVEGFERVAITYPDEWKMGHVNLYWQGRNAAGSDAAPFIKEICAALALCSKIEGLDAGKVGEYPLSHWDCFRWIVDTVLNESYYPASRPPKNP